MADLNDVPATLNLSFRAGDRFQRELIFHDGGRPLDLTPWTFTAQVRVRRSADTAAASFTITTTNAATGVLVVTLSPAQTRNLNLPVNGRDTESYVWDFQATRTTNTDDVRTWFVGTVTVGLDVTR